METRVLPAQKRIMFSMEVAGMRIRNISKIDAFWIVLGLLIFSWTALCF